MEGDQVRQASISDLHTHARAHTHARTQAQGNVEELFTCEVTHFYFTAIIIHTVILVIKPYLRLRSAVGARLSLITDTLYFISLGNNLCIISPSCA